jgi:hypothetical protein
MTSFSQTTSNIQGSMGSNPIDVYDFEQESLYGNTLDDTYNIVDAILTESSTPQEKRSIKVIQFHEEEFTMQNIVNDNLLIASPIRLGNVGQADDDDRRRHNSLQQEVIHDITSSSPRMNVNRQIQNRMRQLHSMVTIHKENFIKYQKKKQTEMSSLTQVIGVPIIYFAGAGVVALAFNMLIVSNITNPLLWTHMLNTINMNTFSTIKSCLSSLSTTKYNALLSYFKTIDLAVTFDTFCNTIKSVLTTLQSSVTDMNWEMMYATIKSECKDIINTPGIKAKINRMIPYDLAAKVLTILPETPDMDTIKQSVMSVIQESLREPTPEQLLEQKTIHEKQHADEMAARAAYKEKHKFDEGLPTFMGMKVVDGIIHSNFYLSTFLDIFKYCGLFTATEIYTIKGNYEGMVAEYITNNTQHDIIQQDQIQRTITSMFNGIHIEDPNIVKTKYYVFFKYIYDTINARNIFNEKADSKVTPTNIFDKIKFLMSLGNDPRLKLFFSTMKMASTTTGMITTTTDLFKEYKDINKNIMFEALHKYGSQSETYKKLARECSLNTVAGARKLFSSIVDEKNPIAIVGNYFDENIVQEFLPEFYTLAADGLFQYFTISLPTSYFTKLRKEATKVLATPDDDDKVAKIELEIKSFSAYKKQKYTDSQIQDLLFPEVDNDPNKYKFAAMYYMKEFKKKFYKMFRNPEILFMYCNGWTMATGLIKLVQSNMNQIMMGMITNYSMNSGLYKYDWVDIYPGVLIKQFNNRTTIVSWIQQILTTYFVSNDVIKLDIDRYAAAYASDMINDLRVFIHEVGESRTIASISSYFKRFNNVWIIKSIKIAMSLMYTIFEFPILNKGISAYINPVVTELKTIDYFDVINDEDKLLKFHVHLQLVIGSLYKGITTGNDEIFTIMKNSMQLKNVFLNMVTPYLHLSTLFEVHQNSESMIIGNIITPGTVSSTDTSDATSATSATSTTDDFVVLHQTVQKDTDQLGMDATTYTLANLAQFLPNIGGNYVSYDNFAAVYYSYFKHVHSNLPKTGTTQKDLDIIINPIKKRIEESVLEQTKQSDQEIKEAMDEWRSTNIIITTKDDQDMLQSYVNADDTEKFDKLIATLEIHEEEVNKEQVEALIAKLILIFKKNQDTLENDKHTLHKNERLPEDSYKIDYSESLKKIQELKQAASDKLTLLEQTHEAHKVELVALDPTIDPASIPPRSIMEVDRYAYVKDQVDSYPSKKQTIHDKYAADVAELKSSFESKLATLDKTHAIHKQELDQFEQDHTVLPTKLHSQQIHTDFLSPEETQHKYLQDRVKTYQTEKQKLNTEYQLDTDILHTTYTDDLVKLDKMHEVDKRTFVQYLKDDIGSYQAAQKKIKDDLPQEIDREHAIDDVTRIKSNAELKIQKARLHTTQLIADFKQSLESDIKKLTGDAATLANTLKHYKIQKQTALLNQDLDQQLRTITDEMHTALNPYLLSVPNREDERHKTAMDTIHRYFDSIQQENLDILPKVGDERILAEKARQQKYNEMNYQHYLDTSDVISKKKEMAIQEATKKNKMDLDAELDAVDNEFDTFMTSFDESAPDALITFKNKNREHVSSIAHKKKIYGIELATQIKEINKRATTDHKKNSDAYVDTKTQIDAMYESIQRNEENKDPHILLYRRYQHALAVLMDRDTEERRKNLRLEQEQRRKLDEEKKEALHKIVSDGDAEIMKEMDNHPAEFTFDEYLKHRFTILHNRCYNGKNVSEAELIEHAILVKVLEFHGEVTRQEKWFVNVKDVFSFPDPIVQSLAWLGIVPDPTQPRHTPEAVNLVQLTPADILLIEEKLKTKDKLATVEFSKKDLFMKLSKMRLVLPNLQNFGFMDVKLEEFFSFTDILEYVFFNVPDFLSKVKSTMLYFESSIISQQAMIDYNKFKTTWYTDFKDTITTMFQNITTMLAETNRMASIYDLNFELSVFKNIVTTKLGVMDITMPVIDRYTVACADAVLARDNMDKDLKKAKQNGSPLKRPTYFDYQAVSTNPSRHYDVKLAEMTETEWCENLDDCITTTKVFKDFNYKNENDYLLEELLTNKYKLCVKNNKLIVVYKDSRLNLDTNEIEPDCTPIYRYTDFEEDTKKLIHKLLYRPDVLLWLDSRSNNYAIDDSTIIPTDTPTEIRYKVLSTFYKKNKDNLKKIREQLVEFILETFQSMRNKDEVLPFIIERTLVKQLDHTIIPGVSAVDYSTLKSLQQTKTGITRRIGDRIDIVDKILKTYPVTNIKNFIHGKVPDSFTPEDFKNALELFDINEKLVDPVKSAIHNYETRGIYAEDKAYFDELEYTQDRKMIQHKTEEFDKEQQKLAEAVQQSNDAEIKKIKTTLYTLISELTDLKKKVDMFEMNGLNADAIQSMAYFIPHMKELEPIQPEITGIMNTYLEKPGQWGHNSFVLDELQKKELLNLSTICKSKDSTSIKNLYASFSTGLAHEILNPHGHSILVTFSHAEKLDPTIQYLNTSMNYLIQEIEPIIQNLPNELLECNGDILSRMEKIIRLKYYIQKTRVKSETRIVGNANTQTLKDYVTTIKTKATAFMDGILALRLQEESVLPQFMQSTIERTLLSTSTSSQEHKVESESPKVSQSTANMATKQSSQTSTDVKVSTSTASKVTEAIEIAESTAMKEEQMQDTSLDVSEEQKQELKFKLGELFGDDGAFGKMMNKFSTPNVKTGQSTDTGSQLKEALSAPNPGQHDIDSLCAEYSSKWYAAGNKLVIKDSKDKQFEQFIQSHCNNKNLFGKGVSFMIDILVSISTGISWFSRGLSTLKIGMSGWVASAMSVLLQAVSCIPSAAPIIISTEIKEYLDSMTQPGLAYYMLSSALFTTVETFAERYKNQPILPICFPILATMGISDTSVHEKYKKAQLNKLNTDLTAKRFDTEFANTNYMGNIHSGLEEDDLSMQSHAEALAEITSSSTPEDSTKVAELVQLLSTRNTDADLYRSFDITHAITAQLHDLKNAPLLDFITITLCGDVFPGVSWNLFNYLYSTLTLLICLSLSMMSDAAIDTIYVPLFVFLTDKSRRKSMQLFLSYLFGTPTYKASTNNKDQSININILRDEIQSAVNAMDENVALRTTAVRSEFKHIQTVYKNIVAQFTIFFSHFNGSSSQPSQTITSAVMNNYSESMLDAEYHANQLLQLFSEFIQYGDTPPNTITFNPDDEKILVTHGKIDMIHYLDQIRSTPTTWPITTLTDREKNKIIDFYKQKINIIFSNYEKSNEDTDKKKFLITLLKDTYKKDLTGLQCTLYDQTEQQYRRRTSLGVIPSITNLPIKEAFGKKMVRVNGNIRLLQDEAKTTQFLTKDYYDTFLKRYKKAVKFENLDKPQCLINGFIHDALVDFDRAVVTFNKQLTDSECNIDIEVLRVEFFIVYNDPKLFLDHFKWLFDPDTYRDFMMDPTPEKIDSIKAGMERFLSTQHFKNYEIFNIAMTQMLKGDVPDKSHGLIYMLSTLDTFSKDENKLISTLLFLSGNNKNDELINKLDDEFYLKKGPQDLFSLFEQAVEEEYGTENIKYLTAKKETIQRFMTEKIRKTMYNILMSSKPDIKHGEEYEVAFGDGIAINDKHILNALSLIQINTQIFTGAVNNVDAIVANANTLIADVNTRISTGDNFKTSILESFKNVQEKVAGIHETTSTSKLYETESKQLHAAKKSLQQSEAYLTRVSYYDDLIDISFVNSESAAVDTLTTLIDSELTELKNIHDNLDDLKTNGVIGIPYHIGQIDTEIQKIGTPVGSYDTDQLKKLTDLRKQLDNLVKTGINSSKQTISTYIADCKKAIGETPAKPMSVILNDIKRSATTDVAQINLDKTALGTYRSGLNNFIRPNPPRQDTWLESVSTIAFNRVTDGIKTAKRSGWLASKFADGVKYAATGAKKVAVRTKKGIISAVNSIQNPLGYYFARKTPDDFIKFLQLKGASIGSTNDHTKFVLLHKFLDKYHEPSWLAKLAQDKLNYIWTATTYTLNAYKSTVIDNAYPQFLFEFDDERFQLTSTIEYGMVTPGIQRDFEALIDELYTKVEYGGESVYMLTVDKTWYEHKKVYDPQGIIQAISKTLVDRNKQEEYSVFDYAPLNGINGKQMNPSVLSINPFHNAGKGGAKLNYDTKTKKFTMKIETDAIQKMEVPNINKYKGT